MGRVWEDRTVNSLRLKQGNGSVGEQNNKVVHVFVERHKQSLFSAAVTEPANITEGIFKPKK